MTDAAHLRLVDLTRQEGDPIPLERRSSYRYRVNGRVTALLREVEDKEAYNRICSFQLVDMSPNGIGVFCQEPLPENAFVTVFIPPHGPERGFDVYGQIVRCQRKGQGYEIGIRHGQRILAA